MMHRLFCVWSTWLLVLTASLAAKDSRNWDRSYPAYNSTLKSRADDALKNQFVLQGVTGTPEIRNGAYNWDSRGPKNDKEWAWFLNRHRYFEDLYIAYSKTGDPVYVEKIFSILADWIQQHKSPPAGMSFSSAWRPLEAARRVLESWDIVYLELWNDPHFPVTLKQDFLEALSNHGDYLQDHHALYGNHLITEMLALLKLSILLPDDAHSNNWQKYALEKLDHEYTRQFYPEGAHKELSSHYQRVVLLNFQKLLTLLELSQNHTLIQIWKPRVEGMWAYFNAIQKNNGYAPLNNDSDEEHIAQLLKQYQPKQFQPPRDTHYFKQAGQVIFRDPSHTNAPLWAFFDIGPRGTDHQHEDFLHLSLSLGEQDILVDNGRYTYQPGPWRDYFQGPRSHNVLLVDGHATTHKPNAATGPLSGSGFIQTENYTAAWGEGQFRDDSGAEIARWQRSVILLPEAQLLVLDHLITFRPRVLTGFWHFGSEQKLTQTNQDRKTFEISDLSTLSYQDSSHSTLTTTIKTGKSEPNIQGWHSPRFNSKTPAPTLEYTTEISKPTVFAWLFSPQGTSAELTEVTSLKNEIVKLNYSIRGKNNTLMIRLAHHRRALTIQSESGN